MQTSPRAERDGWVWQVKVYVYELPPQYNVWLYSELNTVASYAYRDGLYGSGIHPSVTPGGFYVGPNELSLHERFAASARRTHDPEQADFFFIPAWGQAAKLAGAGVVHDPRFSAGLHGYYESVRAYVAETWPYWERSGGRDHIWVAMGDHGLCESPRGGGIPPALVPSIVVRVCPALPCGVVVRLGLRAAQPFARFVFERCDGSRDVTNRPSAMRKGQR